MVTEFTDIIDRQKALKVSVRDTPRPTPAADDAARSPSTSRRRPALPADTLPPRLDHSSGAKRQREGEPLELADAVI